MPSGKRGKDIRWLLTNVKKDWERIDIRRSSRLWVKRYKPKGYSL